MTPAEMREQMGPVLAKRMSANAWSTIHTLHRTLGEIHGFWFYIEHIAVSVGAERHDFNVHYRKGYLFS